MEEELIQIVDAYRQMVPTEKLFELIYKSKEYYLSFDGQQELLQHLIYDSITSKYPPCRRYILRFLQRYLEELELNPATTDISDELCEEIALLVKYNTSSKDPTTQDLYHLSYRNPKECKLDLVITCRVARCCNEVGLKLWEAALYLAEFSLLNPTLFRDRKILGEVIMRCNIILLFVNFILSRAWVRSRTYRSSYCHICTTKGCIYDRLRDRSTFKFSI